MKISIGLVLSMLLIGATSASAADCILAQQQDYNIGNVAEASKDKTITCVYKCEDGSKPTKKIPIAQKGCPASMPQPTSSSTDDKSKLKGAK
jgi:hypothetical protein